MSVGTTRKRYSVDRRGYAASATRRTERERTGSERAAADDVALPDAVDAVVDEGEENDKAAGNGVKTSAL